MKQTPPFLKLFWIVTFCLFQVHFLYSQETKSLNIESDIPTSQVEISEPEAPIKEQPHEFKEHVLKIDNELQHFNYSNGMAYIQSLYNKVKEKLETDIDRYFPNTFRGYNTRRSQFQSGEFEERSYGVIFAKSFKDKRGRTIDVNVIYADDSIHEYERLIENPNLVNGIENVNIITLNKKYKAIQKSSEEQNFFEENIVVNRDLLINIIGVGMSDIEVIDTFSKTINISALEKYLK
jgi:hypothetical protein